MQGYIGWVNYGKGIILFRIYCIWVCLFLISFIPLDSLATPAILTGVASNAFTGQPIIGAKITVNGESALTTAGGVYSLSVSTPGTFAVYGNKRGYDPFSSPPMNFQPGAQQTLNVSLSESILPPDVPVAMLDTVNQKVDLSWGSPRGEYELLYDDGIAENFTVWAFQGNMNAVRFTPVGFPARLTGGMVNIGNPSNYPSGCNPLVPFQIQIFNANGVNGGPGTSLAGPYTIVPVQYGWVSFNLPDTLLINNGSVFIAMIQGGNAPNAAGISIDETSSQFRSFSRFVTGNSPWFPSGGNFLIRANMIGPGGPAMTSAINDNTTAFKVWRLRQGEEQNSAAWDYMGTTSQLTYADQLWAQLPCGPYRWAIKASYPQNLWSVPAFSNVLGKCWTAPVTVSITTSCPAIGPIGSMVRMQNLSYPDTCYSAISSSSGIVNFGKVWKGNYKLVVSRFAYDTLTQTVPVVAGTGIPVTLLQVKVPPQNLVINDTSLVAIWSVPHYEKTIFSENWSSGTFTANHWSLVPAASNWSVSAAYGNPMPSAMFSSMPQVLNYEHSLVSPEFSGTRSTLLKLKYDIFLDNYGTTTVNQLAVELWDGAAWNTLKVHSNLDGNIPWTSEILDISSWSWNTCKFRFRAEGGDSYDLNRWNIDNIAIVASEPAQQQANCILGYYFYLNNAIAGYTDKNAFQIPPGLVQFGTNYNGCVRALYGSGYSDPSCDNFTSRYLYPARNLTGAAIENAAYLTWEKPEVLADTVLVTPDGLIGYNILRNDSLIDVYNDPNALQFYDYNLEPGVYHYKVVAVYDLTSYGFPGLIAQSLPAGPATVTINWGRILPFYEPWNSASFSFNEWTFSPNPGNWNISLSEGLPSPGATFASLPVMTDYDVSLISPALNGLPYSCAAIWLDFDLKLSDRYNNGSEKLFVEVYYNGTWHRKAEFQNSGSFSWTKNHIDLSAVHGKGFRVRFRAMGQNSSNILSWCIDNIFINPVCYPAVDLSAVPSGAMVHLTWRPPVCHGGRILQEGFEDNLFPPAYWDIINNNTSAHWMHAAAGSIIGVHAGNFSAALNWDYTHQDEWIIARDVFINGNLTFWSYAYQGSLHQDHYFVKISLDHGQTWTTLLDLSALPVYNSANGYNEWETPYNIDLSGYSGETADLAWNAVDGDGNGLWYPWAIDDCSVGIYDAPQGSEQVHLKNGYAPSSGILGYHLFRRTGKDGEFIRISQNIITDTTYLDQTPQPDSYYYFVQSIFEECENPSNSDTVQVDVLTGTDSPDIPGPELFPDPADDYCTIRCSRNIEILTLYSAQGLRVNEWKQCGSKSLRIDTGLLENGLYILRIEMKGFVDVKKLIVQH